MEAGKGNVLLIGNSGVGKSTLVNAVLGEDRAETGFGTEGTTRELRIYENDAVSFRLIDSIGFEPTFLKEHAAIRAVQRWSKDSAKAGREDTQIHVIWFCVDGTAAKLFDKTIDNLIRATSMWKGVPVIVVITKSYSVPDREQNIRMIRNAFAKSKKGCDLREILPVVAQAYVLNPEFEGAWAPPEGIEELIAATDALMPEGMTAGAKAVEDYRLRVRRTLAHGTVATATAAAAVVGAVPLVNLADSAILTPLEVGMINAIARVYGIRKDDQLAVFSKSIVDVGAVTIAAKSLLSVLANIPGLQVAGDVLNAAVAGSIVAALGEVSVLAFEQIAQGKRSVADVEWVRSLVSGAMADGFAGKAESVLKGLREGADQQKIVSAVLKVFLKQKKDDADEGDGTI